MKKFSFTILLMMLAAIHAAAQQGVHATVELITGTTQKAMFLGVANDTVSLGGTINGKFTVVRIARDRFKSITDDNGVDLLAEASKAPAKDSTENVASVDSVAKDTVTKDTAATDTLAVDSTVQAAIQDSTLADSTLTDTLAAESLPQSPLAAVNSRHVLVAIERRSTDSTIAHILNNLTSRMLQETGTPVAFVQRSDFGSCQETSCIKDSLHKYNAASAYVGRITSAKAQDSVNVQMVHFSFVDSAAAPTVVQISLSAMNALNDAISKDKFKNFILQLQGEKLPPPPQNKNYIHIETDPEGANLAIENGSEICRSPCTFASTDTGKVTVYAYWNVNQQLWGTKSVLKPIPFDTTKISLRLKRVRPELRVSTTPEGAEIFAGSAPITKSTSPLGISPNKFAVLEPGPSTIQIKKRGYRDTTVTLFIPPTELTSISVELQPIVDVKEQLAQEEWLHERKKSFIGKTLMGSSIAPFLLGALFTYLATVDYNDANDIKQELNRPAAAGGTNYQKRVQENHDLVHKGDRKMVIGGSLIGTGVLLLGVGIVLAF